MPARHHLVADDEAGRRLDAVLAALPEVESRAAAERLLREGAVLVDGVARAKSHRLRGGELISIELPEPRPVLRAEPPTVPVVYSDDVLLVVDKPAGLAVHPGAGIREGTLAAQLLSLGATGGDDPTRPGIVHRLDRDTSGLLVVARTDEAFRGLREAMARREIERRYLALVRGHPRSQTGRIDAPLGRDRRDPTRRSLDTDEPHEAVTRFTVLERMPAHALLEVLLDTGRTHQIRVHLAAIGLPVCGDPVYGVPGDLGLERQFLHAHRLRLRHPLSAQEIVLESPLPPDLLSALERARRGE